MTRHEVISDAINKCMKELYSFACPKISWEEFEEENKIYSNKYTVWENYNKAYQKRDENPELWLQYKSTFKDWDNKSIKDCIGPKPYEFYYLPEDILKGICNSYIDAYVLDTKQELLNTIKTLKDYCKNPIVDKWIEGPYYQDGTQAPGHRGYGYPDNLEEEIKKILGDIAEDNAYYQHKLQDKFFEFLDMAGNFFNWNGDLDTFNLNVYLGASPNSNKEAVIENWKKYRNKDIEIDEEQIKKDYYGEED